jgi:hypothetical protein
LFFSRTRKEGAGGVKIISLFVVLLTPHDWDVDIGDVCDQSLAENGANAEN